jgi:hypothetical protein
MSGSIANYIKRQPPPLDPRPQFIRETDLKEFSKSTNELMIENLCNTSTIGEEQQSGK